MRIWSIRHEYLDVKRLTAQWREALLCRNVLKGLTKGYRNHPQFNRIKSYENPLDFINAFLQTIYDEAKSRGYKYDITKIEKFENVKPINVTYGQAWYEFSHLQLKIERSGDTNRYFNNQKSAQSDGAELKINKLFCLIPGDIESFEKVKQETIENLDKK